MKEVEDTLNKIKDFEESIDYVLLPEQEKFPEDPAQDPHGIADRYDKDLKGVEEVGGGNEQGGGIGGKSGVNPEL